MEEQEGGTRKKAKERARKAGLTHTHMHAHNKTTTHTKAHRHTETQGKPHATQNTKRHKHRTAEKAMKTPQRWPLDGHTLSGGGSLPVS